MKIVWIMTSAGFHCHTGPFFCTASEIKIFFLENSKCVYDWCVVWWRIFGDVFKPVLCNIGIACLMRTYSDVTRYSGVSCARPPSGRSPVAGGNSFLWNVILTYLLHQMSCSDCRNLNAYPARVYISVKHQVPRKTGRRWRIAPSGLLLMMFRHMKSSVFSLELANLFEGA
jgi:hypothetical protein